MNEFGITKIMDGVFISDLSLIYVRFYLIQDQQFLIENKVSHIIVWTAEDIQFNEDQAPIKMLKCQKSSIDGLLPSQEEINKVFECIEESKQQCLCSLICSDFQSEAAMLLSTYIIKRYIQKLLRFNWDLKTVFNFLTMRFQHFEPRVEIVEQIQDFQLNLEMTYQRQKLKSLQFSYQFLSSYQTDDYDQLLLINTLKNMSSDKNIKEDTKKKISKRRKRIQWFDKLRPSQSLSSINSKYSIYHRNSSLKPKTIKPSIQQSIKPYQSFFENKRINLKLKKDGSELKYGEFIMDEIEFQSVKDLMKPKSSENNHRGSLRKVNSLKLIRPVDNTEKENRQNRIRKIYSKESQLRNSDSKSLFDSLKTMSRAKLGLSA